MLYQIKYSLKLTSDIEQKAIINTETVQEAIYGLLEVLEPEAELESVECAPFGGILIDLRSVT